MTLFLTVSAQSKTAEQPENKSQPASWEEIKWEKWGIAYSVPEELKLKNEMPKSNPTRPDGYFGDSRNYERSRGNNFEAPRFELTIDITNWKGEIIKDEYDGKVVELTPAQMIEIDYDADQRTKQKPNSPIEESDYLEIDGIKGCFDLSNMTYGAAKDKSPKSGIRVIWETYRLYKGNIQRILIFFDGQRKELETMKKSLNSFKFTKA